MATTQSKLNELEANLDESIGLRSVVTESNLSPVANPKDIGRRPMRNAGRILVEQIIPDPSQPRSEFCKESMDRLTRSIQENGLLAPIRVRWSSEHQKWLIVCGERRWRACRAAKLERIECCFDDDDCESRILEKQMIENLLREELTPMEQARGFSALMELNGWNGKQVAEALNIPASTVSRALALLDLPAEIQGQVDSGEIPARTAYEISKVKDDTRRRELAARAVKGMTLQETQSAVRRHKKRKPKPQSDDGVKRSFFAENGIRVFITANQSVTYHHVLAALKEATEEVQHRIYNNIRI